MSKKSNVVLKFAMDAAEIMLSNGAETNRVEETMKHILKTFTSYPVESFVTTTGIISTMDYGNDDVLTMVRRVKTRAINLEKVSLINDLSRRLERNLITLDDAIKELEEIKRKKPYNTKARILIAGISCAGFSQMFGGHPLDTIGAFITGCLLFACLHFFNKNNVSTFMVYILGGCVVAISVLTLLHFNIGVYMDTMIISSIMLLVPGVGLTNAVRDILAGDYLSGISRIIDATLIGVCIATGVGVILSISIFFS